jgi:signal peptidase I
MGPRIEAITPLPPNAAPSLAGGPAEASTDLDRSGARKPGWRDWTQAIGAAVLLFAVLRGLVVQVYGIQSGSMQPTLAAGDYVVVNNTLFGATLPFSAKLPALREPRVGDVVVYRPAGYVPSRDFIKRIVGGPGDTVQMANGVVTRNGARVAEPFAQRSDAPNLPLPAEGPYNFQWQLDALPRTTARTAYAPSRDNWGPLLVPPAMYLMLGDDRNGSIDSRHTGFVPRGEVRGKVLAVHWSSRPRPDGGLPVIQWSRIGMLH